MVDFDNFNVTLWVFIAISAWVLYVSVLISQRRQLIKRRKEIRKNLIEGVSSQDRK